MYPWICWYIILLYYNINLITWMMVNLIIYPSINRILPTYPFLGIENVSVPRFFLGSIWAKQHRNQDLNDLSAGDQLSAALGNTEGLAFTGWKIGISCNMSTVQRNSCGWDLWIWGRVKLATRPGKRLQKTNWKDPPCYSWENQLFRLGHGFKFANCECHYQRVYDKTWKNP